MPDLSEIKRRMERETAAVANRQEAPAPVTEPTQATPQRPQPSNPAKPPLRPETLAQLREFEKAAEEMREQEAVEKDKIDLGPLPEGAKILPDDYEPTFYRNNNHDNKRVREAVEARCTEMDFVDLVMTGRVSQVVPVIPGKLTFEFQSLTGADSFWIESNAQLEVTTEWGLKSWILWAQLTMSLTGVNGKAFPNHLGKDGEVDAKLFKEKQAKIMRMGAKILDIAVTNMNWFNERVDKILQNDFEQLGNG